MSDMYKAALEAENEVLRERVKKLKGIVDSAIIWVDDNVGTLTAKALKNYLEEL